MNQTEITMGQRIAQRRKALNMTQENLAQRCGVTAQAVSKWEHDQSCPDISILPKLAKILGITADELISGQAPELDPEPRKEEQQEEELRAGIHVESDNGKKWDIHFDPPKKASFSASMWLICVGLLMLAGPLLSLKQMGFWSAVWISALIVWGVSGMLRRIRFSNTVAALGGVYFALEGLGLLKLELGWEILFPALILLLGLSLMLDGARTRHSGGSHFHVVAPGVGNSGDCWVEDGFLRYADSFGEQHFRVDAPELSGGNVSVSFGEHVLDFSGVERVTDGCTLEVSSSFGEVVLRIPRRFRVNFVTSKSFAELSVRGEPDAEPEGVIQLISRLSFGELRVEYI